MRPLHKKLIDQFQMMRASLYHVSGPLPCPAVTQKDLRSKQDSLPLDLCNQRRAGGRDVKGNLSPLQRWVFIQEKDAQGPLIHSLLKEQLDSRAKNVFSRYCAGEERFSSEEERAKVCGPHVEISLEIFFIPRT